MGLFERKKDFYKDSLMIKFDLDSKSYRMTKWNTIIPENKLNKETRKLLEEYNKKLEDNELLSREIKKAEVWKKQRANHDKRSQELEELGIREPSFTVKGFTPGTISNALFDYLLPILSEENVIIGIHRVGYTTPEIINDMFEKGFTVTGHGLNFAREEGASITENFGIYEENIQILDELTYANGYKSSMGSIIIRIPDKELKDKSAFTEQVFIDRSLKIVDGKEDTEIRKNVIRTLKPEYIIGYVPVDKNMHIENIALNPNYGKKKDNNIDKTKDVLATELIEKNTNVELTDNLEETKVK